MTILEVFKAKRFQDFSLTQWLALTPTQVVADTLNISTSLVKQVRQPRDCGLTLTPVAAQQGEAGYFAGRELGQELDVPAVMSAELPIRCSCSALAFSPVRRSIRHRQRWRAVVEVSSHVHPLALKHARGSSVTSTRFVARPRI